MTFDINSKLKDILADARAKAILDTYIPGASSHPQLDMGLHMSLKEISYYPESGLTKEKLAALVEDLSTL